MILFCVFQSVFNNSKKDQTTWKQNYLVTFSSSSNSNICWQQVVVFSSAWLVICKSHGLVLTEVLHMLHLGCKNLILCRHQDIYFCWIFLHKTTHSHACYALHSVLQVKWSMLCQYLAVNQHIHVCSACWDLPHDPRLCIPFSNWWNQCHVRSLGVSVPERIRINTHFNSKNLSSVYDLKYCFGV